MTGIEEDNFKIPVLNLTVLLSVGFRGISIYKQLCSELRSSPVRGEAGRRDRNGDPTPQSKSRRIKGPLK